MSRSSQRAGCRIAVLLLLLLPLAAPARAAVKAPSRHREQGLVAWVRDGVAEIQKTFLPDATGKGDSHGGMDPDGLTSTPADGDSRGTMDPDGH